MIVAQIDRRRRLEARFEVTEPAGEGSCPKLLSRTQNLSFTARPTKLRGDRGRRRASPSGTRARRSGAGRSGSESLTCVRALMTTSDRLGALIATGAGKRAGGTLSKARVAADWETRGSHSPTGHPSIPQGLSTGDPIQ